MPDTKETFPRPPSSEQTLLTELGQVKREAEGLYAQVLSAQDAYGRVKDERDKLQAFKSWVHAYLDAHDVPNHPPGPHGAEGCRVGDRMDWLMAKLANAEQAVDHIAAEDRAERDAANAEIDELGRVLKIVATERDALAVTAERYRLALLRITFNDYSQADIRAHVADALLCTIEELEGME